jgi:hypothetical protein
MKTKKLLKKALKHPELHTEAELIYFQKWLDLKKQAKSAKMYKEKKSNS